MRRAQGLALNTIIIAILVVVVLVVVILLFVGTMSNTGKAITQSTSAECSAKGGFCTSQTFCDNLNGKPIQGVNCQEGLVCCATKT